MSWFRSFPAIVFVCALAGCSAGPRRQPEIGEAYAGPATLKLRRDIDPHSPEVASANHGDRLGIIGRRRRFVKVRTPSGREGWTDLRQLMSPEQMAELNELAETAKKLPSQGAAAVYEALNVHTNANRQAPSFYRVKEGELVDVVGHALSPRVPFETKSILPPPVLKPKPVHKPKEEPQSFRPPMPPAPKVPDNWLELSKTPVPDPADRDFADEPPEPAKPVPIDDFSLIRLNNGRAGWVLTSNLKMNIPDEVAQYSEGHQITSYFATADVNDGGQIKHNWLWTTISTPKQPYDFDSFRYFVWNTRRHRYETAYVERNLMGYHPVEVHPVQVTSAKKTEMPPGFSLLVEEDGVRYRKTYAYQVYLVRLVSKEQVETPADRPPAPGIPALTQPEQPQGEAKQASQGFWAKFKEMLASLKARWFGKK